LFLVIFKRKRKDLRNIFERVVLEKGKIYINGTYYFNPSRQRREGGASGEV
jgi:hypothetical protein